jgi:thiol:disulfide interchange protein DsbD
MRPISFPTARSFARAKALALLCSSAVFAQGNPPATTMTTANAHLSLSAFAEATAVSPKTEVTVTFDISPRRRIHVYAPGAEYQVVSVKLDPQPGVVAKKIEYPPSEIYIFEPTNEMVPVYQKPFTLKQIVAVSPAALKGKNAVSLSGTLDYQACDDKVCFKPNSIPFKFEVDVKQAKPTKK